MKQSKMTPDLMNEVMYVYLYEGLSIEEIAFQFTLSIQMVKRILAETGCIQNLSWHKTKTEYAMLDLLKEHHIYDEIDLYDMILLAKQQMTA